MDLNTGRIHAISVSQRKGTTKENVPQALLIENHGIEGDAHAGPWHRQVSLLAMESIETMLSRGAEVSPGDFAENITTVGVNLLQLKPGDFIRLGDTLLEITQIGKECHAHCAIWAAVGDCVMPREGIFGKVICGGVIRLGDAVAQAAGPDSGLESEKEGASAQT